MLQKNPAGGETGMNLSHYFVLMFLFAILVFILVSIEERKRERAAEQREKVPDDSVTNQSPSMPNDSKPAE
jgi:hypothetical protein